ILQQRIWVLWVLIMQTLVFANPTTIAPSEFRGLYRNHKYGYAVLIPKGMRAIADDPPAPQHGIAIPVTNSSAEQISIDGSYNAMLWATIEEGMKEHVKWLSKDASSLRESNVQETTLGGLRALRKLTNYVDRATGEMMVQDLTLALRKDNGEEQVVYTIELRTRNRNYKQQKVILDEVITSWRLERIGK